MAERFFAAVEAGDTDGLARLLATDVVIQADGGGKAPARISPIVGAIPAAKFLAGLGNRARADRMSLTMVDVNGQPGALALDATGATVAVVSLDIADDRIVAVRSVVNPDKLAHLTSPGG